VEFVSKNEMLNATQNDRLKICGNSWNSCQTRIRDFSTAPRLSLRLRSGWQLEMVKSQFEKIRGIRVK